MPYIEKEKRKLLETGIQNIQNGIDTFIDLSRNIYDDQYLNESLAKMLTYTFYKLLVANYKHANWYLMGDVDKILESVRDEFHRNFIHPYEDQAKKRNGDV